METEKKTRRDQRKPIQEQYDIILQAHEIFNIQSTLVISKSKGPFKTLRDIRTSTYQICSTEEKTIRTTKFHK